MRNEQVLSLRTVNRVPESPAADRFVSRAMTALGETAGKTGMTFPTRRDRADAHPVADLVAAHPRSEVFDDADRLVADHQPFAHRLLTSDDVQVRPADRRHGHANHRLTSSCPWTRSVLHPDVVHAVKSGRNRIRVNVGVPPRVGSL